MQKGFAPVLILVGILVIMAIAGGAYYFGKISNKPTPTPPLVTQTQPTKAVDETANWKTFVNTVYGYSISYPSDWSVVTGKNCQLDTSEATAQDSFICFSPQPLPLTAGQVNGKGFQDFQERIDIQNKFQGIWIIINIKPPDITSHDYFKQYVVDPDQTNGVLLSNLPRETTSLFKKNNSSLDITTDDGPGAYITRSSQDAIVIILGTQNIDSQLAYKIFSTFKYTDNNPVTPGNEDFIAIQQDLAKKHDLPIKQLRTTVEKAPAVYSGLFAQGGDYEVGAGGGGLWVAAKVGNLWKIVWSGNGVAECSAVDPYRVPASLISGCVQSGEFVNR